MSDAPTYPSGLRLAGRRVVVVGGGQVAQRRVPGLIAAGADVVVVSPVVTPAIEGLAGAGEITVIARPFEADDVDGAWYVVAATDDASVNAAVGHAAEARHTFCVRSDDATAGSAWTPAVGRHGEVTVAVLGDQREVRDPRRTARLRDRIVESLTEGRLEEEDAGGAVAAGEVVLVGGGPGDPALVSVAGHRALMGADVVIADRLAPRELLGDLPDTVQVVDVAKLPRGRSAAQEEINRLIVEAAQAGRRVVRFKGGDNFVFGRGFEEVLACRAAGVPVRIIPGLSSSTTVPGLAGIPVTHRGVAHSFMVISGHLPPGHEASLVDWAAAAQVGGTLVLLMAVDNAAAIAHALRTGGRSPGTPVAVICDGSMPTERTVLSTLETLAEDLAAEQIRPPAIIVVGDVVAVAHPERYPAHSPARG